MVNVKTWKASDGKSTSAELHKAIEPSFTSHLINGFYPGQDFKQGVDMAALEHMKFEIEKFLDLDPRGGYFSQLDLYAAVRQIASTDAVR